MTVHSALPEALTAAAHAVLAGAGVRHVVHGDGDPVRAAVAAAGDSAALATWAGVTRDDEPGCEDAARHRGTVLRMVARDTVVAARVSAVVRGAGQRAVVVAGDHDYGRQLDAQLRLGAVWRVRGRLAARARPRHLTTTRDRV